MQTLPDELLSLLSAHLAEQMGLHFPAQRWGDLQAGIHAAAREQGTRDAVSYASSLLAGSLTKAQVEALAGALTIGETYFFRDPRSFEIISNHVLPQLIRARRGCGVQRLRVWSAGCCTGEEAYSLAIMLDHSLPDLRDWQVTVLATDINRQFLRTAAAGIYGEWSFRGAPDWLKERYFTPLAGARYEILPHIRQRVTFAYLNLATDVYPALVNNTNAMDLILCRNVLMYFAPERIDSVIRNFHDSLVSTGWLHVSAVESSARFSEHFAATDFDGATLYRKKSAPLAQSATSDAASRAWSEANVTAPVVASAPSAAPPHESAVAVETPDAYEAALALFKRGRYAQAAEVLTRQAVVAASVSERALLLARIHANLGELREARSWTQRAIAADRTNAAAHYLDALILQEQDHIAEAHACLRRALYLEPDFVLAHFAMGNLARRPGGPAADRHFTHALALLESYDDNDVLPHSDGMAAGRLRETIQAIAPAGVIE